PAPLPGYAPQPPGRLLPPGALDRNRRRRRREPAALRRGRGAGGERPRRDHRPAPGAPLRRPGPGMLTRTDRGPGPGTGTPAPEAPLSVRRLAHPGPMERPPPCLSFAPRPPSSPSTGVTTPTPDR